MNNEGEPSPHKKVKVRVNLSGTRYVGYVCVYPPKMRVSDVLNEENPFMTLSEVESIDPVSKDANLVVNKTRVVYVQVIEEVKGTYHGARTGDFVKIRIRTQDHRIKGEIFLPADMAVADRAELLNRNPHFLNVRNAEIVGTNEQYDFLAISTEQIYSLEIDRRN